LVGLEQDNPENQRDDAIILLLSFFGTAQATDKAKSYMVVDNAIMLKKSKGNSAVLQHCVDLSPILSLSLT
jgi:hypothetical protein